MFYRKKRIVSRRSTTTGLQKLWPRAALRWCNHELHGRARMPRSALSRPGHRDVHVPSRACSRFASAPRVSPTSRPPIQGLAPRANYPSRLSSDGARLHPHSHTRTPSPHGIATRTHAHTHAHTRTHTRTHTRRRQLPFYRPHTSLQTAQRQHSLLDPKLIARLARRSPPWLAYKGPEHTTHAPPHRGGGSRGISGKRADQSRGNTRAREPRASPPHPGCAPPGAGGSPAQAPAPRTHHPEGCSPPARFERRAGGAVHW